MGAAVKLDGHPNAIWSFWAGIANGMTFIWLTFQKSKSNKVSA
jgi:hypothetical protein